MDDRVLGALYGMAMGDAMGMPPELWSREKLIEVYGWIDDFLDGHPDNTISFQYPRGSFTDDTSQGLAILDSLIETDFTPDRKNIAGHILKWANSCNAAENNILGPTSKLALAMIERGEDPAPVSGQAFSNGAAMRIAPVGTLFSPDQAKKLCDYVADISKTTHASGITIAGAAMVAMAVSSAVSGCDREEMLANTLSIEAYARSLGTDLAAPSLTCRIRYGIALAHQYKDDKTAFLSALYEMMGAGVNTADSVPCAIAIAYYSYGDAKQTARLCANLGGDTDTIGAMAVPVSAGFSGASAIASEDKALLNSVNHVSFEYYAEALTERRKLNCHHDA